MALFLHVDSSRDHDNLLRFLCDEMPCQGHLQAVRRDRSSTNGQGPCMTGWQQLQLITRWWSQILLILIPTRGNDPI